MATDQYKVCKRCADAGDLGECAKEIRGGE